MTQTAVGHLQQVRARISLEEIGDFNFASNVQVKNVEKKVDAVLIENKRLADREKILEMRAKKVESENKPLLKKIEADQIEMDIMKVKLAELEEEKARRDEQNKYFELKNKEFEAAKAVKEHELYMMNKVIENMIEQRFEEIEVEELRAKRQAEIDAEMKYKGKGVEGSEIAERSIVLSTDPDVLFKDITAEGDEEDDDEEDEDDEKVDDVDDIFSASSRSDDDDDDDQGGTGVTVTEALTEQNVDDLMHDHAHEDRESAESEGSK
ncbi:kinesin-related protein 4-like [Helianthus annuus]|uniref:kinesin-related protein 4-like n=1 Tax=Helianthus annuus TaxID=4232 RepID=UPI000B8F4D64|nr:kinesin-related protein 4-like [Helianthus annuus]